MKDQVEQNTGQRIDPKSPVLGWLIEYAGVLYTLFSYDESLRDGLTPFRKLKGRDWTVALPPFGELVDYRVRTQHKLEPRWDEGVPLGVRMSTTEKIIGTPKGVVVVQSVRRKPEGSRWSSAAIEPWAPSPARERAPREALELPEPVAIEPERPEVEAAPVEVAELRPHLKRVYLRQDDFDQYGYTAGCKACSYLRTGLDRQGVPHSEECRARVVQRLQETERGQQRIDAAKKREAEAKDRSDTSKRTHLQEEVRREGQKKLQRIQGWKVRQDHPGQRSSCRVLPQHLRTHQWVRLMMPKIRSSVLFCQAEKVSFPQLWLVERKSLFVKKSFQRSRRLIGMTSPGSHLIQQESRRLERRKCR